VEVTEWRHPEVSCGESAGQKDEYGGAEASVPGGEEDGRIEQEIGQSFAHERLEGTPDQQAK